MNNNPENVMKNLESYGKETGFTVPDGYYDDLYQKMMGKVVVEKQKTHHRRQILKFSLVSGAAAAVALFITLNIVFKNDDLQSLTQPEKMFTKVENPNQPTLAKVTSPSEIEKVQNVANTQVTPEVSKNYSQSNNNSKRSVPKEQLTDETTVLSVVAFYEEDARTDEFQEALMDLECYYDF